MNLIIPFGVSLILSLILTPLTILFAKKYGLVDDPRVHKHPAILHKRAVPRAGGIPIFLAFVATIVLTLGLSKQIIGVFLGGLLLVVVGIMDDKYDLKNSYKLFFQILAALLVIASGVGITFITNPFTLFDSSGFGLGPVIHLDFWRLSFNFFGEHSILVLADIFALFWIVWVINMVNFSTGVDGQMPGIVFASLMVIFIATLRFFPKDPNELIVTKMALVGAGATLGFLFFNFYPAKIFPGDSGSYFLGFLVAVLAILAGARVGTAILVMAVPLIDGVFTIIRRIINRQSPFVGDRKHLQHRLMELGWGQRRVALFYWLLCAILGLIALTLSPTEKLFAGIVSAIIVLGGLLWLNMSLQQKAQD
ncbi:undecaprenyl/decaprenyl-phosphate alpha-N-acetylglucosaminyl 1-phosphate transferase [Candidatus Curtissbacteria bacterium]|nr:undecaprenyl/decaprenyl-phosphate alpha-N-acetylglucosaminyl 1-phosphate transferase [Candidatus Curtissbacteria bacterium]